MIQHRPALYGLIHTLQVAIHPNPLDNEEAVAVHVLPYMSSSINNNMAYVYILRTHWYCICSSRISNQLGAKITADVDLGRMILSLTSLVETFKPYIKTSPKPYPY